jgi:glycosyltransferase involved in cell wall biosynthesis
VTPRALLLTGSLGPGGTELAVMALARGLARRGRVDPRVAVIGTAGRWGQALRAAGIPVDELGLAGPLRRPRALARLLSLARLVRRERIDVLHTFLFDADVYGMLAARLGRPRAVITTRRAIKSGRPHHLRGYRLTNRLVHRIVANSEAVRVFTLERERVAPDKVRVIPNGVDAARFAGGDRERLRRELGVAADELLVGAVGTIKPVKGQAVLLEAAAPLLAARPDLKLVLAGTPTAGYGERLRARVREVGVSERVLLPGSVEQVPDLLAALDLFVLPSLSEGMSNALLEAMAAGRPIVATRVGGNAECLAEGEAGVLVPSDDADALRTALGELLDDPARRAELARRAAARARDEYGLDRMLARTEDLYGELLGS